MRVFKINKTVGRKIQKIRRSKGISQEELGFLISVHRNHIGRIERGETSAPLHLLEKIARVLKVHIRIFFD